MSVELIRQRQLEMRARSLSERTIIERTRNVERFLDQTNTTAQNADATHIIQWLANQPNLTPNSRDTYYRALKSWFKWLQKRGHRHDNPVDDVDKPRMPPAQPRPAPLIHVERVLNTDIHIDTRMKILLATWAGLRVSEIAAFRGVMLDPIARTL